MTALLIAAVCGLVALVLLFGLVCMAALPLMKRWAEKEAGPWVVRHPDKVGGSNPLSLTDTYLTFLSPGHWYCTTVLAYAERFPHKHDAEEWARVVGGEVVTEREVGRHG